MQVVNSPDKKLNQNVLFSKSFNILSVIDNTVVSKSGNKK